MKKSHKLVITPRIELLSPRYTYRKKGELSFECSCGHKVEIKLLADRNWPCLIATCDIKAEHS